MIEEEGKKKHEYVFRECKLKICKTVIKSTVTYACETWLLNKIKEEQLKRWERKILSYIFSGKNTEEGWKKRTNLELILLNSNKLRVDKFSKVQRIRLLGYL